MANDLDSDYMSQKANESLPLDLASSETEKSGIRVTRAEFSRIMGCSKQAVTEWVKNGRVLLGFDNRLDPRQAVSQLLRTGDPSRLRAKILEPLVRELHSSRQRIVALEAALADARDDVEFEASSAAGILELLDAFKLVLEFEWSEVCKLPVEQALAALVAWLEEALKCGVPAGFGILAMAARIAIEEEGEAPAERSPLDISEKDIEIL